MAPHICKIETALEKVSQYRRIDAHYLLPYFRTVYLVSYHSQFQVYRDALIQSRSKNAGSSVKSDSGIGSTSASSRSGTTPSTPNPISKSSSIASLKDEDDILDQLARQTSMALKGGKVPLEDDSTSSSDGATPAPGSVPSTYDVISLTF